MGYFRFSSLSIDSQCPNNWPSPPSPQGLAALMEPLATHYFCNVTYLQPLTGNRPMSATVMFLLHKANLITVRTFVAAVLRIKVLSSICSVKAI